MAANIFQTKKLGELCKKIGSGATPRGGNKVYLDSGEICLIRSQNVKNDRFDRNGLVFIDQNQAKQLANVSVEINDVLLNITGDSVARCCQVDSSILPARVNQHVAIIRPNSECLDPQFLRYYLVTPMMQNHMLALASAGATRHALTKSMIESFVVQLPPLEEQKTIANILGSLDVKIELNRKMNETLEAMAQAIFKSWFIDFDPVIDNALAAGKPIPDELKARAEQRKNLGKKRKPLPKEIQKLFPDEFVKTDEMGWVPKGWEIGSLLKITKLQTTSIQPNTKPKLYWSHFSIPSFDEGQIPSNDIGESIKSGKYLVPSNSILVSKLNPHFPRIWLTSVKNESISVCSTEFMPFVANNIHERSFIYVFFKTDFAQNEIMRHVSGSTGSHQRVKPKDIAKMSILLPSGNERRSFDYLVSPLLDRLLMNREENYFLSKCRNLLLPNLLAGKLDINRTRNFKVVYE